MGDRGWSWEKWRSAHVRLTCVERRGSRLGDVIWPHLLHTLVLARRTAQCVAHRLVLEHGDRLVVGDHHAIEAELLLEDIGDERSRRVARLATDR